MLVKIVLVIKLNVVNVPLLVLQSSALFHFFNVICASFTAEVLGINVKLKYPNTFAEVILVSFQVFLAIDFLPASVPGIPGIFARPVVLFSCIFPCSCWHNFAVEKEKHLLIHENIRK